MIAKVIQFLVYSTYSDIGHRFLNTFIAISYNKLEKIYSKASP